MSIHQEIKALSDKNLVRRIEEISVKENQTTAELVLHLIEMDQRRLFVQMGYPSLFQYCRRRLKYSEPATNRRISSARAIGKVPELYEALLKKEVSITTISLVAGIINEGNGKDVLHQIRGKSRSEVEAVLARYRPRDQVREQIKPVVVCRKKQKQGPVQELGLFSTPNESTFSGEGSDDAEVDELHVFRFAADNSFLEKYREIEQLLSHKHPCGVGSRALFQELMEFYLKAKSPRLRHERRKQRKNKIVQKKLKAA